MHSKKKDVIILTPVYNDWQSLNLLIDRLLKLSKCSDLIDAFMIYAINDGSSIQPDYEKLKNKNLRIINLTHTVGHQKAITLGLAYVAQNEQCDIVVVMDADGEDRPEDIERLLDECLKQPGKIIFARRSKRKESFMFKFFYALYKFIFKILTGEIISFGNFSAVPSILLHKLVRVSAIWNHYSSGVIKSKLPFTKLPIDRGKRYKGNSKMKFNSFVLHGLSAIAVQIDVVSVRILLATLTVMALAILGILIVTGIRMFAEVAVPGWATNVVLGLIIFLMQTFLISLVLAFIILNYRTQKLFIPAKDYKDYVLNVEVV